MANEIVNEADRLWLALDSRARRKRYSRLNADRGSTLWAPRAVGWWIAVLFAVGSFCFAVGSVPWYVSFVGGEADALTFFIGSLWFTSAAFLQVVEVANADDRQQQSESSRKLSLVTWDPRRVEWWSTIVQFVGTLFFNATTFHALSADLSVHELNRLVWAPDALGSACFLIASGLAWFEVCRAISCWRFKSIPWWITALNLLGSIAFGVSAIASLVLPTTGVPINVVLVNLGTFVGALCFFVGALLLLPERTLNDSA